MENYEMNISKIISTLDEAALKVISDAEITDLIQIPGIGKIRAAKLKESAAFLLQIKLLKLFKTIQDEKQADVVELPQKEKKSKDKKAKKKKSKKKKSKKKDKKKKKK